MTGDALQSLLQLFAAAALFLAVLPLLAGAGRNEAWPWSLDLLLPPALFAWTSLGILLALLHLMGLTTLALAALLALAAARLLAPPLVPQRPARLPAFLARLEPRRATRAPRIRRFRPDPALLLLTLVLLAVAFWAASPFFRQVSPARADGYLVLLAIKDVALNLGLLHLGNHPLALDVLLAEWATALGLDPLQLLRFTPAFTACLTSLGGALLAYRLTASVRAAWPAALLTGFTLWPALTFSGWDALWPLSLSLALALFPFVLALSLRPEPRLPQLAMAVAAVGLSDPRLVPVTFLAAWVATLFGKERPEAVLGGSLAIFAGSGAGLLPYALMGRITAPLLWTLPPLGRPLLPLPLLLALTSTAGILLATLGGGRAARGGGAALLSLTALGAFATARHVPFLPPALVVPTLGLTFVAGVAALLQRPAVPQGADLLLPGAAVLLALILTGVRAPRLHRFEPVGTGRAVLAIAASLPRYTWTIVSPVDQYSEVLGQGFHEELVAFVRQHPLGEPLALACGPGAIPTPNVFLFVDLRPDGRRLPRSAAEGRLPAGTAAYRGRAFLTLEARAFLLAEVLLHRDPHAARVFFRNRDLMVLWIRQEGTRRRCRVTPRLR